MIALIWIAGAVVYLAIASAVGVKAYWVFTDHNSKSRGGTDAEFNAGFIGLLWPLGVWLLIAVVVIYAGEDRRERLAEMNAERDALLNQARKELADQ